MDFRSANMPYTELSVVLVKLCGIILHSIIPSHEVTEDEFDIGTVLTVNGQLQAGKPIATIAVFQTFMVAWWLQAVPRREHCHPLVL